MALERRVFSGLGYVADKIPWGKWMGKHGKMENSWKFMGKYHQWMGQLMEIDGKNHGNPWIFVSEFSQSMGHVIIFISNFKKWPDAGILCFFFRVQ